MDVFLTIVYAIMIVGLVLFCLVLFLFLPYVAKFADAALGFIAKPLKLGIDELKEKYDEHLRWRFFTLDEKFCIFGNFWGFVAFCVSCLIILIYTIVSLLMGATAEELGTILVENTMLGSFASLIDAFSTGSSFTPFAVVAIGVSSFISDLVAKSMKEAPWYMRVLGYTVFLAATAVLAMLLTGVFSTVGIWGFNSITALYNQEAANVFLMLGKYIALALLCYFAIMLLLMTVKAYASCLAFVPICLLIIGLAMAAAQHFWPDAADALTTILAVVMIIGIEVLQNYSDQVNPKVEKFAAWLARSCLELVR